MPGPETCLVFQIRDSGPAAQITVSVLKAVRIWPYQVRKADLPVRAQMLGSGSAPCKPSRVVSPNSSIPILVLTLLYEGVENTSRHTHIPRDLHYPLFSHWALAL